MKKSLIILTISFVFILFGFVLSTSNAYAQCSFPNSCDSECTPKVCGSAGNCTPSCTSPEFCVDNLAWDDSGCCCEYQSSQCELSGLCGDDDPPPTEEPDPGTVTGRVYCLNSDSPTNNYNVSGAPLRVLESGSLLESTTSDNTWGTEADNFSMTFTPDSSDSTFSVRSGTSGGNGLYSPVNQRPFCSTAHESCTFPSVEGTTVSNFDFFTDLIVSDATSACSVPGDSITMSWGNIPLGDKYILRVDNQRDGWDPYSVENLDGIDTYKWVSSSSCTAATCTFTIDTSSTPPFETGEEYYWSVQPIDIDGGQHCQGSGGSFSCACTLPEKPALDDVNPDCSDTPKIVKLDWDDVPNTDSYVVEINGTEYPATSSEYEFEATPLQGYTWRVRAKSSCGDGNWSSSLSFNMDACAVAWMQAKDADLLTRGDIDSWVPSDKYLIDNNDGNSPGVAIYGEEAGDKVDSHDGSISKEKWNANSEYSFPANQYTYEYFENLAPRSGNDENYVRPIVSGDIGDDGTLKGANFFINNCPSSYKYCWFTYDGEELGPWLIIDKNETIKNKKIILMVDGSLQFGEGGMSGERRIKVEGKGFFMAIVEGNINVLKEFYHSGEIELEGIYFTENGFITEGGSEQLHLKGMLAAMGGLSLNRDLGLPDNLSIPSEKFEYGPELLFSFPSIFSRRRTIWREVSP